MNMAEGLLPKVLMTSTLSQEKDSKTLRALGGFLLSLAPLGTSDSALVICSWGCFSHLISDLLPFTPYAPPW